MGKKLGPLEKLNAAISDTWVLEIAALALALIALAIIIVLLSVYDGQPQFSFAGVTLNTVIAILAACVRIGLVLPVSEALSQWKWIWYSKSSRPLTRFASLDDASRGSKGSLALLWETKGLSLTSIGAAIVLLSVATEPFIQQTVNFRQELVFANDNSVQIPYSKSWSGGSEMGSLPDFASSSTGGNITKYADEYGIVTDVQLDLSGQAAVQFGLNANSTFDVAQQLPVKCLSGNCTWPAFDSLAICSRCTNLDDQIEAVSSVNYPMAWFFPSLAKNSAYFNPPENLTSYSLRNGLNLNNRMESYYQSASAVMFVSDTTLKPSDTVTFKNATTLLLSTSMLRVPPSDFPVDGVWQSAKPKVSAMECGLYLCIKKYNSKVVNGSLTEDSTEIVATRDPDSFSIIPPADGSTLSFVHNRTSPDVDALYSNTTYFPRTPLTIKAPATGSSDNLSNGEGSITQAAIDGLSSYILSIFDQGTFANSTAPGNETGCSFGNNTISCAGPRNITGMAVGDSSLLNTTSHSPDSYTFSPAVTELLYNSPDLDILFQNIADSITNEMRKNANNQPTIPGSLGTVTTVLDVRWPWIVFPTFLVLASLLFFLLSVFETYRGKVPLWKSSLVAVLYHGLEEKARDTVQTVEKASDMDREAEELSVQLRRQGADNAWLLRTGLQNPHSVN